VYIQLVTHPYGDDLVQYVTISAAQADGIRISQSSLSLRTIIKWGLSVTE